MEFLLIAGLAVIIIGSVVLTIWYGPGSENPPQKPMYKCRECGHEFEIDPDQGTRNLDMMEEDAPAFFPDCPKCKAKESGTPMARCHKCKKYYVSPLTEYQERREAGEAVDPVPPANVCPHCNTDQREFLREKHRKKGRK